MYILTIEAYLLSYNSYSSYAKCYKQVKLALIEFIERLYWKTLMLCAKYYARGHYAVIAYRHSDAYDFLLCYLTYAKHYKQVKITLTNELIEKGGKL